MTLNRIVKVAECNERCIQKEFKRITSAGIIRIKYYLVPKIYRNIATKIVLHFKLSQ